MSEYLYIIAPQGNEIIKSIAMMFSRTCSNPVYLVIVSILFLSWEVVLPSVLFLKLLIYQLQVSKQRTSEHCSIRHVQVQISSSIIIYKALVQEIHYLMTYHYYSLKTNLSMIVRSR